MCNKSPKIRKPASNRQLVVPIAPETATIPAVVVVSYELKLEETKLFQKVSKKIGCSFVDNWNDQVTSGAFRGSINSTCPSPRKGCENFFVGFLTGLSSGN